MDAKFDFFERVRIITDIKSKQRFRNTLGTVLAKGKNKEGVWSYDVSVDKDKGYNWGFDEHELEATGNFITREDFYGTESSLIKVLVTPEGKGYLKEDYEKIKNNFAHRTKGLK